MQTFGIDIGYGYTKAVSADRRTVVFPSATREAPVRDGLAEAFGGGRIPHRLRLTHGDTDEVRLVGEAALAFAGSRSWDERASSREDYPALLLAALALLGAEGEVRLGLGLPLAVYRNKAERHMVEMRLEGLGVVAQIDDEPRRRIEVVGVQVLPQAVGAYFAGVAHSPSLRGRPVGVVDIGFRTTDVLFIRSVQGRVVPDDELSDSFDLGASQASQAAARAVSASTGRTYPVDPDRLEAALQGDGRIAVRGVDIDVRPFYQDACRVVGREIGRRVARLWGTHVDDLAAVVVAGGGGERLAPHLGLPGARVLQDAIFANAYGFLSLVSTAGGAVRHPGP